MYMYKSLHVVAYLGLFLDQGVAILLHGPLLRLLAHLIALWLQIPFALQGKPDIQDRANKGGLAVVHVNRIAFGGKPS